MSSTRGTRAADRRLGIAAAISAVLLGSACSDGGAVARDDEGATSAGAAGSSDAATTPATQGSVVDFGNEPGTKRRYKRAALRAVGDGLITMVPTLLPKGWRTVGGGYAPDPQWWRMEFTAPSGDVTLDQLAGTTDDVLSAEGGTKRVGEVDLTAWGTGPWATWSHDGTTVMTYDLKGSAVVLQGADEETLTALAQSLLPAEDAAAQEG